MSLAASSKRTTQQIVVLTVSVISAAFLLMFLFLIPRIKHTESLHQEVSIKKENVRNLIAKGVTPVSLANQLALLFDKSKSMENSLLKKGEEIKFIQFMEELSAKHQIKQEMQLGLQDVNDAKYAFQSSSLSLVLHSSFYEFMRYLIDLEKSPYYVYISSILIMSGEDGKTFNAEVKSNSIKNRLVPNELIQDSKYQTTQPIQLEKSITVKLDGIVFFQK